MRVRRCNAPPSPLCLGHTMAQQVEVTSDMCISRTEPWKRAVRITVPWSASCIEGDIVAAASSPCSVRQTSVLRNYCCAGPNIVPGDNLTYPQICPPTLQCQIDRLGSNFCDAQGIFEPVLCLPGFFCPNFTSMLPCPEGTYCIRGSYEPTPCPTMSSCPPQSEHKLDYGGMLLTLLFDVCVALLFVYLKYVFEPRLAASRTAATKARRTLAEKSGDNSSPLDSVAQPLLFLNELGKPYANGNGTGDQEAIALVASSKHVLESSFRRCNSSFSLDLSFDDLSMTLPAPINKTILSGVSGRIQPGRVTAIMGPSGAGKTTFMAVLMDKVPRTSGVLHINGEKDEMYRYRKIVGYVPQDDTMMPQLTVRENILFSARMRLPREGWSAKDVDQHVSAIIDVLGLTECADTLIGDALSRGVSGGQRKRTNIGIELAAAPTALFLDEPTSGLDSAAALEVCKTLRSIADLGLTVVAVVHQPRLEIFNSFDDLLLLAPGGVTAYIGPNGGVIPYFKELGYEFSTGNNPADELLDFVAGRDFEHMSKQRKSPESSTSSTNSQVQSAVLDGLVQAELANGSLESSLLVEPLDRAHFDSLLESSKYFAEQWQIRSHRNSTALRKEGGQMSLNGGLQPPDDPEKISAARGATFLRQMYLCHNRSVLQQYRQVTTYALEMGVATLAGGMMGAAATAVPSLYQGVLQPPYTLMSPAPLETLLPSIGFYVCLAVGLAGSPAGVLAFGEEKLVYYREAAAGHDRLAYYIGKTISVFYRFVIGSLHYTSIFILLATPTSSFGNLFAIVLTQFYCVYGLAAVISMVVKRENSALLAVIISMIVGCLCGFGPNINQFDSWHLNFVPAISYARWGVEAWFDSETLPFRRLYMVEQVSAPIFGYTLNRFDMDLAIVVTMGTVYRAAAYVLLILINRSKQR